MEFFTITDPSDWPSSMPELKTIDTLLRCGICYEFFDIAMILPKCSHNYCSMCIRRYLNYKSQCPTCNAPAEASQLCNNRTLDELVTNFKAVRPMILKLCKEEAKKSDNSILKSPQSEPSGGKQTVKETILSPPREQLGGKKMKKSSPFFKESNIDSDGDFTVESRETAVVETPKRQTQRRSNYQKTVDKISSHASSSEEDPPMQSESSTVATSSSVLNRSNEENIDPTYQVQDDGDHSDEDVFSTVTPSKPSTSSAPMRVEPAGNKNTTPATRSEKVDCPVCGVPISSKHINVHLDSCLTKSEEKEAKRRVPKRKPLPKIVSSLLSDKEMRKKLKEHGLSSQGNRSVLNKRLLEFTLMYNAQCDSSNPMPVEAIVKEFNKIDKLKSQPNPIHTEQRLKVTRSLPEDEIAKAQEEYMKSHGSHFRDLIKNTKERIQKSKKAGKPEEKEQSGPELPSVSKVAQLPTDETMPGTSMTIPGDETVGKDAVCDDVNGGHTDLKEQSSAFKEATVELKQNEASVAQVDNANSSDAFPVENDMAKEESDVVARKRDGSKICRLKLKKSKYFAESIKDIDTTDKGGSSESPHSEDKTKVEKTQNEDREETPLDENLVMAIKMDENSEEQMDITEDVVSPVFGQCSVGSSGGKALSGSSTKKTESDVIDTVKVNKEKESASSSSVPSPPSVVLLKDIDTISEGSSLVTLESFSDAGSHGDVPSPGEVNCIPESPEAIKTKKPKGLGRRKRKPEVVLEEDGSGVGKETRVTRSRKRGKTSAD